MLAASLSRGLAAAPLLAQSARTPASLAEALDRRLNTPPFHRHLWGVAVVDRTGRTLYARNADRLFVPASTAKLAVSAAATVLLSPDFTVRTSVYATGPITDGVLHGDLVLYGRGDPTFSRRCYGVDTLRPDACEDDPAAPLRRLAEALRARGLRTVSGDVVGDGSYFEPLLVHPHWENYDLNWWYAAPVSGLGFNDNSIDITWSAGPRIGAPARIVILPAFAPIELENRSVTSPGDTGTTIDFFRAPGTLRVRAVGRVAQRGPGKTEYFALPDPNFYTAHALRAVLVDAGIAVLGAERATVDSTTYLQLRATPPLAEVTSRPLRDWIFAILNRSQNWFAEMTLKQLGRQVERVGSWEAGLAVERRFLLDSVGIEPSQVALTDGSGLAGTNLITPLALTRILRYMRAHPHWETFAAALPRSAARGSLQRRFIGTPLEGRVLAKPGTIGRVNALAGFVELSGGRWVSFAVLANHHALPSARVIAQLDSVVVDIARALDRRP